MLNTKYTLAEIMRRHGTSRAEAAAMLHVSPHTIDAWLKPSTSRSANPVPMWAVELLAFKCQQPVPPLPAPPA